MDMLIDLTDDQALVLEHTCKTRSDRAREKFQVPLIIEQYERIVRDIQAAQKQRIPVTLHIGERWIQVLYYDMLAHQHAADERHDASVASVLNEIMEKLLAAMRQHQAAGP